MKLTHKIKLNTTKEQFNSLLLTTIKFNVCCNFISEFCFKNKLYSKFKVHKQLYYQLKEKYNLSAQLVVRAIDAVCCSYKINKKKQIVFKEKSAVIYDQRILSYKNDFNTISIWTVNGRLKIPICIYDKTKMPFFQGQADLLLDNKAFYLLQTLEIKENELKTSNDYLGVDLGIVNIATTSDGEIYTGKEVEKVRQKYTKLRSNLQSNGSKSAKRHLKKISKKESRFRKDVNHVISKKIVQKAKDTCKGIKVEELKNFFNKKTVRKSERNKRSSWSFFQLRSFMKYKAELNGIEFLLVNPAYTSQTCSCCGFISKKNRKSQEKFKCISCGLSENADLNAALNISKSLGVSVNKPMVAVNSYLTVY